MPKQHLRLILTLLSLGLWMSGCVSPDATGLPRPTGGTADTYVPKFGNPRPVAGATWTGRWNGAGTAYVACQDEGVVSVVDLNTNEVVKRVLAGKTPHHPYLTLNRRWVLVTTHHDNDYVLAINTADGSQAHRIPTGPGSAPLHYAESRDAGWIALTLYGTGELAIIDPATARLVRTIPNVGRKARDPVVALGGRKLFIMPSADSHITVVDTHDWQVRHRPRHLQPGSRDYSDIEHSGMDVSPDGRLIAFTNPPDGEVVFIDAESEKIIGRVGGLPDPGNPSFLGTTGFLGTANSHDGSISIIDTRNRRFTYVKTVPIGKGANIPNVGPDGRVYVTANKADSVAVVDPATWKVVDRIEGLDGSHWCVFSPDGIRAYITNVNGSTLTVVRLRDLKVLHTIEVGKAPNGIMLRADRP